MVLSILKLPTNGPDPKGHSSLGVFEQLLADIVEAHSLFQEQPLTSAACGKLYVCLLPFVEMDFDLPAGNYGISVFWNGT